MKRNKQGHIVAALLGSIVVGLFVWWALAPVAEALAGALQQLASALGTRP